MREPCPASAQAESEQWSEHLGQFTRLLFQLPESRVNQNDDYLHEVTPYRIAIGRRVNPAAVPLILLVMHT